MAVIGSGIAGMSAAWLLSQRHRVTLYEATERPGGHSNTVDAPGPDGPVAVDTGFIVYNERNYPNLVALFDRLGVRTKPSDMSFSVSLDAGGFEYAGTDFWGMLAQRRNVVRPRFWRMMRDILRFYRSAPGLLRRPDASTLTLGDVLDEGGYSETFARDHLLPMGAAIWSASLDGMRDHPAAAFVGFFENHGLLNLANRPQWRTVDGGSRAYVGKITAPYRDRIRLNCGVRAIRRPPGGGRVAIADAQGAEADYDEVVVAAHADQALAMLADADPREREVLGAFRYQTNETVLHGDAALMPRRRRAWSSWNYIGRTGSDDSRALCVSYWMNRLQSLDDRVPLFVTLNADNLGLRPRPESVIATEHYTHPQFTTAAIVAQARLWDIQGVRNTWFCGSYFGAGFHEDGLQSGLAVAEAIGGVRRPWTVGNQSGRIPAPPARAEAAE
ncbi:MAG: FAD-dependent oxidoreductase [Acetobacterales bacterium]